MVGDVTMETKVYCLSLLDSATDILLLNNVSATENFRMGTRRNAKKKTQREMDRWSKTEHDKSSTDIRGY
jgi:hypothetical protein